MSSDALRRWGPGALGLLGLTLLLATLFCTQVGTWVLSSLEAPSPARELRLAALGCLCLAGCWWLTRESLSWVRLQQQRHLRACLQSEAPLDQAQRARITRGMERSARRHGLWDAPQLAQIRAQFAAARSPRQLRETVERHLLPAVDERVESEIQRSALGAGICNGLLAVPGLEALVTFVFTVRLTRKIADLNGTRPGLVGTLQILRETLIAAVSADLSQHAADALSSRVGMLASSAGQSLATSALLIRAGLWAHMACRLVPRERGSVGGVMARGVVKGLSKCVKAGVGKASSVAAAAGDSLSALTSDSPARSH